MVKSKVKRDEWLCGYACALANVMRNTNEKQIVKMTLLGDGLGIEDLRRAGVEEYDLDVIVRAVA